VPGTKPNVSQQSEAGGQPAQPDCEYPGVTIINDIGDQRHRGDTAAEQVDLGKTHPAASASK
jgi:hypothetical protein